MLLSIIGTILLGLAGCGLILSWVLRPIDKKKSPQLTTKQPPQLGPYRSAGEIAADGIELPTFDGYQMLQPKPKVEVVKWLRAKIENESPTVAYYRCPKCQWAKPVSEDKKKTDHFKICQCDQYPKLHFHWDCDTCGFKAVM